LGISRATLSSITFFSACGWESGNSPTRGKKRDKGKLPEKIIYRKEKGYRHATGKKKLVSKKGTRQRLTESQRVDLHDQPIIFPMISGHKFNPVLRRLPRLALLLQLCLQHRGVVGVLLQRLSKLSFSRCLGILEVARVPEPSLNGLLFHCEMRGDELLLFSRSPEKRHVSKK
jgi:hypothetical protein